MRLGAKNNEKYRIAMFLRVGGVLGERGEKNFFPRKIFDFSTFWGVRGVWRPKIMKKIEMGCFLGSRMSWEKEGEKNFFSEKFSIFRFFGVSGAFGGQKK